MVTCTMRNTRRVAQERSPVSDTIQVVKVCGRLFALREARGEV